jgi:biotin carboxyl carrier protein
VEFKTQTGESHTIQLVHHADGSITATIDNRTYQIEILHEKSGTLLLGVGDKRYRVHVAKEGSEYHISLNGKTVRLEKVTAANPRKSSLGQVGDLTANMPGQVMRVMVAVGDVVKKGDTLVVLEAMKMEMRIKSPLDGRVKAVLCGVGDAVERGQRLVEVEAES